MAGLIPVNFATRLEEFKAGCEAVIKCYESNTTNYSVMPDGTKYVTLWGPHLEINQGPKWAKLQGKLQHGAFTYTFAVVDVSNGNIYRPSSAGTGSVNIKTAKPKGNIYDADWGMANIDHNGPKIEKKINKH
jgi:hypothetical protein